MKNITALLMLCFISSQGYSQPQPNMGNFEILIENVSGLKSHLPYQ